MNPLLGFGYQQGVDPYYQQPLVQQPLVQQPYNLPNITPTYREPYLHPDLQSSQSQDYPQEYTQSYHPQEYEFPQSYESGKFNLKDKILGSKGVQKAKQLFFDNNPPPKMDYEKFQKFGKWSVGFAYIISLVGPLLDVTNFIDLFVENKTTVIVAHIVRIAISLTILILAILSMAKGWKNTPISLTYNIFTKILTVLLSFAYLITLSIKIGTKKEKNKSDIIAIIASVGINIVNIIFLIIAILAYRRGERTISISWIFVIITSIVGIIFSIISISNKAQDKDKTMVVAPTIQT